MGLEVFNYLTVMVSILIGIGIGRLFAGFGDHVAGRRRVRGYWVHSVWSAILVLLHVHVWWAFWTLHTVDEWTSRTFAWVLLGPAGLVLASHIASPTIGDEELDLRAHHYDTSPTFFAILAAIVAWGQLSECLLTDREFFVAFRILPLFVFGLLGTCAVSKNPRLHAATAVVMVLHLSLVLFVLRAHGA